MTCEVVEDDQTARWFKDTTELHSSKKYCLTSVGKTHKLTIHRLELKDTGQYIIDVKSRSRTSNLTVKGNVETFY